MLSSELLKKKAFEHYIEGESVIIAVFIVSYYYCNGRIYLIEYLLFHANRRMAPAMLRQASYGTLKMGIYKDIRHTLTAHFGK